MKCSSKSQAALSSISYNLADSSETEIRQPADTDKELRQPINDIATTQPINAFVKVANQPRQRKTSTSPIKKELKALSDPAEQCPAVFPSVAPKPSPNDESRVSAQQMTHSSCMTNLRTIPRERFGPTASKLFRYRTCETPYNISPITARPSECLRSTQ